MAKINDLINRAKKENKELNNIAEEAMNIMRGTYAKDWTAYAAVQQYKNALATNDLAQIAVAEQHFRNTLSNIDYDQVKIDDIVQHFSKAEQMISEKIAQNYQMCIEEAETRAKLAADLENGTVTEEKAEDDMDLNEHKIFKGQKVNEWAKENGQKLNNVLKAGGNKVCEAIDKLADNINLGFAKIEKAVSLKSINNINKVISRQERRADKAMNKAIRALDAKERIFNIKKGLKLLPLEAQFDAKEAIAQSESLKEKIDKAAVAQTKLKDLNAERISRLKESVSIDLRTSELMYKLGKEISKLPAEPAKQEKLSAALEKIGLDKDLMSIENFNDKQVEAIMVALNGIPENFDFESKHDFVTGINAAVKKDKDPDLSPEKIVLAGMLYKDGYDVETLTDQLLSLKLTQEHLDDIVQTEFDQLKNQEEELSSIDIMANAVSRDDIVRQIENVRDHDLIDALQDEKTFQPEITITAKDVSKETLTDLIKFAGPENVIYSSQWQSAKIKLSDLQQVGSLISALSAGGLNYKIDVTHTEIEQEISHDDVDDPDFDTDDGPDL